MPGKKGYRKPVEVAHVTVEDFADHDKFFEVRAALQMAAKLRHTVTVTAEDDPSFSFQAKPDTSRGSGDANAE